MTRWLLSFLLVACPCPPFAESVSGAGAPFVTGALAGQVADTIKAVLELSDGRADVTVRYPPSDLVFVKMALPAWAGLRFDLAVAEMSAATPDGAPLLIRPRGEGEWEVPAGGEGFSLTYSIRSPKTSFVGDGGVEVWLPTLTPKLSVLWGTSWFVRPVDGFLAESPARVRVVATYPDLATLGGDGGSTIHTASAGGGSDVAVPGPGRQGPAAPRPVESVSHFDDTESLAHSLVLGGTLRRADTTAFGLPIELTVMGEEWRFEDAELLGAAASIVQVQARALGVLPGAGLDVVLLEGMGRESGGMAEGELIVLYADPELGLDDRDPETLRILAHEHLHRWIGEYASSTPARGEGRFKWFQEGVTEYLAFRTLARAGLLDPRDFVFKVNQYIDGYLENPAAFTATADDLERDYWARADYQRLAYQKGFLVAMAADARIQERTGGNASLWDYVALVVGTSVAPEYDDEALLEGLVGTTGEDWTAFFDAYVLGSEPLDLAQLCEDAGLDCRREPAGMRSLLATDRTAMALGRLIR
jgi:predicted metalloprotease with PDZ domain